MSGGRYIRGAAIAALGCLAIFEGPAAAKDAASEAYIAFIERTVPETKNPGDMVRVSRHGRNIAVSGSADLQPGDRIYVRRPGTLIMVRMLANSEVHTVQKSPGKSGADEPDWIVPAPSVPGLMGSALAWLKGVLSSADQSGVNPALAASRSTGFAAGGQSGQNPCFNASGQSNEPLQFDVPALEPATSNITSGDRAIFVSWRGGAPPFSLSLTDAGTGIATAPQLVVSDSCAARFSSARLSSPGRLRFTITDANRSTLRDADIYVGGDLPPMPAALESAGLPPDAKELYYDTWLASQDGGKWAFEAQQRVAAMDCKLEAVRDWLRQWGGLDACPSEP
jgi:hypothetical protein